MKSSHDKNNMPEDHENKELQPEETELQSFLNFPGLNKGTICVLGGLIVTGLGK